VISSGVGRLAFDVTKLGYAVQGNEFSLFMLLASDFMLNGGIANPDRQLEISPWLSESRNSHSFNDQCRTFHIPDIDPLAIMEGNGPEPQFSMAAGDFFSIYNNSREVGQWDSVCSCFFLDACPSIVESIQLIYRMLKPGGYLLNFGPLLYHWSGPPMRPDDRSVEDYRTRYDHVDERYMSSVDISYEDVREILVNVGFEIVEEKTEIQCLYTSDRQSMMNMVYRCVNFVARKVPKDEGREECSSCT
jgi:carnosine N-methyltransferase